MRHLRPASVSARATVQWAGMPDVRGRGRMVPQW